MLSNERFQHEADVQRASIQHRCPGQRSLCGGFALAKPEMRDRILFGWSDTYTAWCVPRGRRAKPDRSDGFKLQVSCHRVTARGDGAPRVRYGEQARGLHHKHSAGCQTAAEFVSVTRRLENVLPEKNGGTRKGDYAFTAETQGRGERGELRTMCVCGHGMNRQGAKEGSWFVVFGFWLTARQSGDKSPHSRARGAFVDTLNGNDG